MRRLSALLFAAVVLVGTGVSGLVLTATAAAEGTAYTAETPVVDTISGGPWNTSQGDPSAGGEYPSSDLLPAFSFGGPETTLGGVGEPNLAVYPGEQKVIENGKEVTKLIPYPSGVAGTPGPLAGYCSTGERNNEKGSPVSPAGGQRAAVLALLLPRRRAQRRRLAHRLLRLPAQGRRRGDQWRGPPTTARRWTCEGEALEQNPGYCPTADTNDDGQGHPFVAPSVAQRKLYTLQRPAGDYEASACSCTRRTRPRRTRSRAYRQANRSASTRTPSQPQKSASRRAAKGVSIPVSTLGEASSPEQIVAGPYEDYNAASPSKSIITCTGTARRRLAHRLHRQPAARALIGQSERRPRPGHRDGQPRRRHATDPGRAEHIRLATVAWRTLRILNGNSVVSPFTTFILNVNAPNRVYIDGGHRLLRAGQRQPDHQDRELHDHAAARR